MIPTEIFTFGASSIISALMKLWAKKQEIERQKWLMSKENFELIERSKVSAGTRSGAWIRRFIVICVIFAVFIAPIFSLLMFPECPVSYAYTEQTGKFLGIFGNSLERLRYVELKGIVLLPIHTQMASCIIGYYFGVSAVK